LGHGRVGKTSAVTAVKNLKKTTGGGKGKVEENEIEHIHSTIGLDCSALEVPTEKKEVLLPTRIWDFA
jgi:hypothetical protein